MRKETVKSSHGALFPPQSSPRTDSLEDVALHHLAVRAHVSKRGTPVSALHQAVAILVKDLDCILIDRILGDLRASKQTPSELF